MRFELARNSMYCGCMSGIFSDINNFDLQSSSATKIKSKVVGVSFGVQYSCTKKGTVANQRAPALCTCIRIIVHVVFSSTGVTWTASSEFGTYRLCEQRFRRACAFAQSRQNLRCSLKQAVSQAKPSDRKPDPWPL